MRNLEVKFSLRFKALRKAIGTQEICINMFNHKYNRGLTAAAISQYENGKRIPEIDTLVDFADFFQVSVDYLLGIVDQKELVISENDEIMEYLEILKNRSEMKMLFSIAKNASIEDIKTAATIIEALKNKS